MGKVAKRDARRWQARIGERWFHDIDAPVANPDREYSKWEEWISKLVQEPVRRGPHLSVDQRVRRYLLEAASGTSASSVKNYLAGKRDQLGEERFNELRRIDALLGFEEPPATSARPRTASRRRGTIQRLALVTEFKDLPSLNYHFGVIRSVLDSAQSRNRSLVIHEASNPDLNTAVRHFVRVHKYDGLVFIRQTPDEELCGFLGEQRTPVVTVHADMAEYPSPPVLANIYPGQTGVGRILRGYVAECLDGKKNATVVLVHMRKENTPGSIRDERIDAFEAALRARRPRFNVETKVVDDYGFQRAAEVFREYPKADFYVCLSDQIAVGIKHLIQATATKRDMGGWKQRVLGFDNSLAPDEGITSFNQHLEQIGPRVMEVFDRFFDNLPEADSRWPAFEPIELPLSLTPGS